MRASMISIACLPLTLAIRPPRRELPAPGPDSLKTLNTFSITFRRNQADSNTIDRGNCWQLPSITEAIGLGHDSDGCVCKSLFFVHSLISCIHLSIKC